MFSQDGSNVYRVNAFRSLKWLHHGFGTRNSTGWPPAGRITSLKQVHSSRVLVAATPGCIGEGDALISDRPGTSMAVRTADCVPLILVDPVRRAVGIAHGGWRGTVAGVSVAAVEAMSDNFGTRPEDLLVAMGPAIGGCCYEVGAEVSAQFGYSGRVRIDLAGENRKQFISAGVLESNITVANLCTSCMPGEFFSYRRDRGRDRMVSVAGIRG